MVDSDRAVADALRENAKVLEANGAEIVQRDAMAYLDGSADRFDVAFVDAPFASGLAHQTMERLPRRLKPGARVYVESAQPLDLGAPWAALREDRAGAVRYALYELTP
jgi:16S rRNA (guanine966-N2)-methyltransferase